MATAVFDDTLGAPVAGVTLATTALRKKIAGWAARPEATAVQGRRLSAASYAFIRRSIAEHARGETTLLTPESLETDDV